MMPQTVMQNVLLVSDDWPCARGVQEVLARRAIRGMVVKTIADAREQLNRNPWDLVLLDVDVPADLAELVTLARQDDPERPVLAIGRPAEAPSAVRALRQGCRDVLFKPLDAQELDRLLLALLPNHPVAMASAERLGFCPIAGSDERFLGTIALARKIAPTSVPVLVAGESGTGKELVSSLIHFGSNRRGGPYVRVNCAALSESLLESELFGHERGAFTGAYAQRKGRFELAHGGTLLLDEISETGPRLQAQLLRVLEQQDFHRVGGAESIRVNVRIVSTTNRNLTDEVEAGRFRRDLYYRLAGLKLTVPPLRQRPADVPVLVWHFVNLFAREVRRPIRHLDSALVEAFARHPWPGNVRQLRNVVRAAMVLGQGPTLTLDDLGELKAELLASGKSPQAGPTLELQEMERRTILEALDRTRSNQAKAARLLGITDRTLREKLRRYRQEGPLQIAGEPT